MTVHILPFSEASLQTAMSILASGGVIAHATETCYGLACDLRNKEAVAKLFLIKQRPTNKPVSGLFPSIAEAKKFVVWNEEAQKLADQYLPGPLTIILPVLTDAPITIYPVPLSKNEKRTTKNSSVGIRISSHEHAQALVLAYGTPLSTTSANVHGKDNPYSAQEIADQFSDQEIQPDLIVDSGELPPVPPSTVVDLTTNEPQKKRDGSLHL